MSQVQPNLKVICSIQSVKINNLKETIKIQQEKLDNCQIQINRQQEQINNLRTDSILLKLITAINDFNIIYQLEENFTEINRQLLIKMRNRRKLEFHYVNDNDNDNLKRYKINKFLKIIIKNTNFSESLISEIYDFLEPMSIYENDKIIQEDIDEVAEWFQ